VCRLVVTMKSRCLRMFTSTGDGERRIFFEITYNLKVFGGVLGFLVAFAGFFWDS